MESKDGGLTPCSSGAPPMSAAHNYGGHSMRERQNERHKLDVRTTRELPRHTAGEFWNALSGILERASRAFGVHTE
jgi:hypothetical protein